MSWTVTTPNSTIGAGGKIIPVSNGTFTIGAGGRAHFTNPPPQATQVQQSPAIGGGIGIGGSVATTGTGGGNMSLADLTNIADPWSSQRGQYQTQLSSLMKDPSSFLQSDLWKASTAAGLEGVNRSAAAGGMLKSGNRLQALMDYGQKNAPENFFRMADLLGGYAGAKNQNPGGGLRSLADLTNAATNQYQAETGRQGLDINRYQAETGRMGVELGNQRAVADQDSAQARWQQQQQMQQQQAQNQQQQWQQQQQQRSMADLQRQMEQDRNFAMNYR